MQPRKYKSFDTEVPSSCRSVRQLTLGVCAVAMVCGKCHGCALQVLKQTLVYPRELYCAAVGGGEASECEQMHEENVFLGGEGEEGGRNRKGRGTGMEGRGVPLLWRG